MELTITLPELHKSQQEIRNKMGRYSVVVCGRRFGKTELMKDTAAEYLLDGKRVAYFTPTFRMGDEVWESLNQTFTPIANDINNSKRRMQLMTKGLLECWSLSGNAAQTVRGRKYHLVLVDEAAYIRTGDIWEQTLRPLLTDYRGSALFASTPKGMNWFHSLYMRGLDPQFKKWKSFHYPTLSNPYIHPAEIEEARLSLPERVFRQEYLAEFVADAGAVFRGVNEVSILEYLEGPIQAHRYVFGVDWGRDVDFTAISVFDATTMKQVDLVRFNQIGWQIQRDRLQTLYEKWKPSLILAEENSIGSVNIEALQAEGLPIHPFMTTAQSKAPLIEKLALAIERKHVGLLNDPLQIAELQAYTFEKRPGGSFKYTAPPGAHDDTVIATALALWAVETGDVISFMGQAQVAGRKGSHDYDEDEAA